MADPLPVKWPVHAAVFSYAYFGCGAPLVEHEKLPRAVAGDIDIFLTLPAKHDLTEAQMKALGVKQGQRIAWMCVRTSSVVPGKGLFALSEFGFVGQKPERIGYYEGEKIGLEEKQQREKVHADKILALSNTEFIDGGTHPWLFPPGMFAWLANDARGTKKSNNVWITKNRFIQVTKKIKIFDEILLAYGTKFFERV